MCFNFLEVRDDKEHVQVCDLLDPLVSTQPGLGICFLSYSQLGVIEGFLVGECQGHGCATGRLVWQLD